MKPEPRPAGLRHYPSSLPGESRVDLGANRNRPGIATDLKQPDGGFAHA